MSEDAIKSAPEIREQAAHWLARRTLGPWDENDHIALNAWLSQSLAHDIEFLRMEAGWNRTERLTALRDPSKPRSMAQRSARSRPMLFRAAAILVMAAALSTGGFFLIPGSRGEAYSTPVGGHKIITLADGSRIELNTDTVIHTDFRPSRREVTLLKGEAYFQIEHDAARPFVVMAAQHRVTDLGTKFLVRNEFGSVQVSLFEGKAELRSASDVIQQHSVVLTPGDVAVASAHSLSVSRRPDKELHDELGWQRGVIVFSHTTLAAAASEFNRYNETKIVIADAEARNRVIGATLPAHDVEAFADVAREIFGLRIQRRKNEIVISH